MTSPERQAERPGAEPGPRAPPEAGEPRESAEICLSGSQLRHVPDGLLRNGAITYLRLQGNQISNIPGSMFISLPNLLWLDLRKNLIVSLPAEIGSHRALKTLLLEGNPISELPPELGNVITLSGLNLRDCPIQFPPQDIVQQGLQSILQYLRSAMAKRPVSTRKTPPELSVVEKLQLTELIGSSMEEQDESVDADELQRFKELKHQLISLDKAELGSIAHSDKNPKSQRLIVSSLFVRKKTDTEACIIPQLPLFDSAHWKRPEERRQATMKELNEKRDVLKHRKKSQETLQKSQAKITQEKKMSEHKQKRHERQRRQEETKVASKPGLDDNNGAPWRLDQPGTWSDRSVPMLRRYRRDAVIPGAQ